MKVAWSKEVEYTPDWNANKALPEAEQIKVKMTIFTLGELLAIREELKGVGFEGGDTARLTGTQIEGIAKIGGKYLPAHITLIGDANFTVQDAVTYSQFFGFVVEILFHLIASSAPKADDVKN